jgi:hypothetical protein
LAVILELLRVKQGQDQVGKKKNGKNQRNTGNSAHELPQLFARLDVEKRQGKKNSGEQ